MPSEHRIKVAAQPWVARADRQVQVGIWQGSLEMPAERAGVSRMVWQLEETVERPEVLMGRRRVMYGAEESHSCTYIRAPRMSSPSQC